ncbi:MAG: proton-conducting transporter membrane subunit [Pseudonocardiaceae bacterium]
MGLAHAPQALRGGVVQAVAWAPELDLALTFRLDALALAMLVLVSGVGALVLVYSGWYFGPASPEAARCAALLLAFAGVMLGLVLADDLITLYVFWELTSIASFLLVGQDGERRDDRRAAVQALLVTMFGGLAMLLGFVLLGEAAGTYRISELIADPPRGATTSFALVLILLGAFTKSAQLPFHPWLPAAMVAPTPVSAYLHAAAMVKAGVYLVARLSPAFADLAVWWVPVVAVGLATMLVGGWRALHETDLKRLLALGTVSQLGFLMVLLGAGGRTAALAGVAMLLAHGLFKAPLFLTVGVIEHHAGSRDVRELSGVGRALPCSPHRRRSPSPRWQGCPRCWASSARRPPSMRSWSTGAGWSCWACWRVRCSRWRTARGSCGGPSPPSPAGNRRGPPGSRRGSPCRSRCPRSRGWRWAWPTRSSTPSRYIAGGRGDVGAAVRVRPPVLVGLGLSIAVLTALAPLLAGAPVLSTAVLEADVPVLGHIKLVTSLLLDLGVYLLLAGVVLDLLRTLGAGIEQDARQAGERA